MKNFNDTWVKKSSKIIVLAAILICILYHNSTCIAQESEAIYYEKGMYRLIQSTSDSNYVIKFNVEAMVSMYLPNFYLLRKRPMWNRGREFVFKRASDNALIFIILGLHPSIEDTEEHVLNFLNSISMHMYEGPVNGELIGDNLWWAAEGSDPNKVTDILFSRKNAFISLYSDEIDLIALAKTIDNAILNGSSYVTISNSISAPVINSVTALKIELSEDESTKLTVNATDPDGEQLEYISHMGASNNGVDPENVLTIIASRHIFDEQPFFGPHTIEFYVINESNFVSLVYKFTINI